jgi:hypothetical protein
MRKRIAGWLLVGALAAAGAAADDHRPAAPPPREVPIAELVRQLGNDDFTVRESALERLSALPVAAPPAELLAALQSSSPEVRERAARAVAAIRANAAERALGRERGFAKRGAIDRFVTSAMTWDVPAEDERLWQAVLDVGTVLCKKANRPWRLTNGGVPVTPANTPANFWITSRGNQLYIRSVEPYRIPDKNALGRAIVYTPGHLA